MLTLATLTLAAAWAVPSNRAIVAGVRIGQVRLGHEVPAGLGDPTTSEGAAGQVWSTWVGSTGNTLDVNAVLGNGPGHEARLVRVTSSWFQTQDGVHTGQTWGHVRAHYPSSALVTVYDSARAHRKLAIMDAAARGVAFEVTVNAAGHATNASRCVAVWVHRAGTPFEPTSWIAYQSTTP